VEALQEYTGVPIIP